MWSTKVNLRNKFSISSQRRISLENVRLEPVTFSFNYIYTQHVANHDQHTTKDCHADGIYIYATTNYHFITMASAKGH